MTVIIDGGAGVTFPDTVRQTNAVTNTGGAPPYYAARAWVNFDGVSGAVIRAGQNVSSITYHGSGDYSVNFTTAMPDANYCVAGWCSRTAGTMVTGDSTLPPTTTSVRIRTVNDAGGIQDCPIVTIVVFR